MTLTQQWRYLNFIRNSFDIKFPAKNIMSYRQVISEGVSTFVYKHSLAEHF